MKQFENVRRVNSPSDFASIHQTARSTIINTQTTFGNPTNNYQSKRARGLHNNHISQSHVGFPQQRGPNSRTEMSGSQMMESHIWHTKRETCHLSGDRLAQIAKKFLKMYGTANEIRNDNVKDIQRQANSHISNFEQDGNSVEGLFQVMDENRDKRITHEDIISLCKRFLSFEKKQINYTPVVQEKLAVARRLFKQFDVEKKGYLTEKQVPYLLKETYKSLGKDFHATEEDIKSWMKLTDSDNDGRVFLPQYQRSIVRALKKQGVQIYDE